MSHTVSATPGGVYRFGVTSGPHVATAGQPSQIERRRAEASGPSDVTALVTTMLSMYLFIGRIGGLRWRLT